MPSRNMKVNINKDLIHQIKQLEVFECKLE